MIEPGRNYGWPQVEGECNTASEQAFCEANDVAEPLMTWSPCVAVNGIEWYTHSAIPEWQGSVLMAVLGGLSGQYERLSVLHMSEDGLTVESEEQHFASFNQRIRDVAVNPYTGAVYLAFNGPQYPGSGPNIIKEFRPVDTSNVGDWDESRGVDVFPNPATDAIQLSVADAWNATQAEVINAQGQMVWQGTVQHGERLDVSTWEAGSYILKLTGTDSGRTRLLTRIVLVN